MKRGTPCPGYVRDRKFFSYFSVTARSAARDHIDGKVAPELAGKAVAQQYREGFCSFIEAKFPGQYYGYSTRVDVNWFQVARNYQDSAGKALDSSLRCIGALQIGRMRKDTRLIVSSQEMYCEALHQLSLTLTNPALVATDSTLAAAILLGAYEMTSMTGQKSWMLHSRGISYLYQRRGACAHVEGLGRTLLSSFRGFLVFEALLRGERCFLEDEEWKSIIPDTVHAERRRGKGSRLGELIEYSFHEIARCPGFLARTRALVASASPCNTARDELVSSITDCQHALYQYQSEVSTSMDASFHSTKKQRNGFTGPIPFDTADILAKHSLQGINSAIALLQQLLLLLKSDQDRREMPSLDAGFQPKNPWEVMGHSSVAESIRRGKCSGQPPGPEPLLEPDLWFDRVSMTMGMLEETPPIPT